jgi:putative pyoverdin transport system ATP-binding/permease protein
MAGPRRLTWHGKREIAVTFLSLFRLELANTWKQFVVLAALSGISNAAVLATINRAAAAHDRSAQGFALVTLALAIFVYSISQKALMVQSASLAERTVSSLRARFVQRLQGADLYDVEQLDRSAVYTAISGEMQVLSDGTLNLVIVGQAVVLLLVITLYLAFLSLTAVLVAMLFIAIAGSIHLRRGREIREQLNAAFRIEAAMMQGFTDFLDGFKEVKLNAARSTELSNHLRHLANQVAQIRLKTRDMFAGDFVASQVSFFLLTGIMVFAVPMIGSIDHETLIKLTASSLFLIGPIGTVVAGVPMLQRVNSAAGAILSMQRHLSELPQSETGQPSVPTSFESASLAGVEFHYNSEEEAGFQVGPIDLEILRGQVLFITGGNGSGKSTLLKLIAGLYLPMSGTIQLNGNPVGPADIAGYRQLFSAVFSDYHLFQRLYGVRDIDPAEADQLFRLLELEQKSRIVDQHFETIALSTGQRKRLALIAMLLEKRPICVFDEWAADQDPHFREKFYRQIIPLLREQGRTIIAVTHDERYFDVADLRIHLEEGRLQPAASTAVDSGAD